MVTRRRRKPERSVREISDEVEKTKQEEIPSPSVRFDRVVSTGSTLLDLAICGGRVRGGGIPPGFFIELFGPPSAGKTAIMVEIAGSIQKHGGDCRFNDTEGRLDRDYSKALGVRIPEEQYVNTEKVEDFDKDLAEWEPKPTEEGAINAYFVDSIAAMTCDWEKEDKDGMGQRKAKKLASFFRKNRNLLEEKNVIVFMTNQVYDGATGEDTPGGRGIKFYSSVRMRVGPHPKNKYIKDKIKIEGKDIEKTIGNRSIVIIKKSSIDDPMRSAPISIVFNYGIDDNRENLQYIKDVLGEKKYITPDEEGFQSIRDAIRHVEENDLQEDLRGMVMDLWGQVESKFKEKNKRKPKQRW